MSSVRSAILLGAVVPDLREAADQLAADLRQLLSLRAEMERERDRLRADATILAEERTRVQLLVEERKKDHARSVAALADEETRAETLAEQATSLKDLISRMEKEIAASAKAKAEAEAAAEKNRELADAERNRRRPTSLGNADRLAPAVSFADAKGLLPLPSSGQIVRNFGVDDGLGGQDPRHFDGDPAGRTGFGSGRWLGGLCRPVPQLRTTLDHQRRRRISCAVGGYG